jgi:hypothetical protein
LKSAESESDKYQGGAIKALFDARVEALRHTTTMLDQKRESFIRRISLSYARKVTWLAMLAYFAGAIVYILQYGLVHQ